MQSRSFNNKLILEAYKHTEVKSEVKSGWATPGQKNTLKGLKVLVNASLPDGTMALAGSIAYIKEESLHTMPWAKNKLKADTLSCEFIIVNINDVEFITAWSGDAA